MNRKRLCVYCGSRSGHSREYLEQAKLLGKKLAERSIGLVYGGAKNGLMGAVADSALACGGEVIGVIPEVIQDLEAAHQGLSEQYVVESMSARKQKMADLSDGFIILPGGVGTYDELFEMLAWSHLRVHKKACGIYNQNGFYDSLIDFMAHAEREGFVDSHRINIFSEKTLERLLSRFEAILASQVSL
ncbi:MAG: TIGR00730 family Rossman fold protein [Opitutaceae bacterium]|nr:TIGR00730 family Rossman fold protein [Opitutaceae bacterium]